MTSDEHWPEGEAYRTPREPPEPLPRCPRCGRGHADPLPDCGRSNESTDHEQWTD